MIKLPGDNGWVQNNRGEIGGTLVESFNIELNENVGMVRTKRSKRLAYTGSPTGFGEVAALEVYESKLYVASEHASAHDIWVGGNSPFDALTNDTTSVEIVPGTTDMKAWNSNLYIATGNELYYTTDGTAWTEIGSNVLTSGSNHLLESMNDVLYVTDADYKVLSVTSGNTFQSSGSQTLNLNLPGFVTTMLCRGLDSLWVGLSNIDGGAFTYIFEWDGETENAPIARYEIDAPGIMAGCVKDGVPYVVDSRGRLLVYNGGVFVEIDRFPLGRGTMKGFSTDGHTQRAIHPRGMTADGDEILITIANRTDEITDEDFNDFPSGVWAYTETNGLHHKLSASYQAKTDTGTTNLTDYGQYRCFAGGPMLVMEPRFFGGDTVSDNGGRIVFAMEHFTDADDTSSDTTYGLFTDDTHDDTQKAGWVTSSWIPSSKFRDNWQKLYTAMSEISSGEMVEVKYRTKNTDPTYFTGTWTGTDRFNTTTELSDFGQGDEITIVQGKGGGVVAHIKELSTGAGSEVVLDRDITGVVNGQTSKFKIMNFKKVGKITDISTQGFTIGAQDHRIQVKAYLQWTGKKELYAMLIDNNPSIS